MQQNDGSLRQQKISSRINVLLDAYPLIQQQSQGANKGTKPFYYEYGTAGFRYPSYLLPPVMVRMGLFASLRSYVFNAAPIGVMITASHNPEGDNGIKIADIGYGRMLHDLQWEEFAVRLVNASTTHDALQIIQCILEEAMGLQLCPKQLNSCPSAAAAAAVIHVGRDTRSSSLHLATLFMSAAKSLFVDEDTVQIVDHGVVTTPMLHFYTMYANSDALPSSLFSANLVLQQRAATEEGYFTIIANAYYRLLQTRLPSQKGSSNSSEGIVLSSSSSLPLPARKQIIIDCSCGVGYLILERFINYLEQKMTLPGQATLPTKFIIVNGPDDGPLNANCGAEYVQKNQLPPKLFRGRNSDGISSSAIQSLWCSLDGDADRIVFHYHHPNNSTDTKRKSNNTLTNSTEQQHRNNNNNAFCLLDGDKIAALIALFIKEELEHLKRFAEKSDNKITPRFGVVQTAYANGNATSFLRVCCS
jgi:phosphoacetylglucosamine mutase